ncbi:hypothetical protein D2A34_21960 [Clostridium chromiireducens]|uniref:Uncharacterized protein n=1 Tax=Clostridium chromiireducens TaxID=225345 RepID=A0A399IIM7_9CLOT|nr:hypothetical protein [Clostridium chromiireducens]RII32863.1 hypothetical protein D2A34_21960 [Clostridium chromiireducens]
MAFSTYLANALVNEVFGGVNWAPPATIYTGLSSTAPTATGGNITEPTIGTNGYARAAATNNTTNFPTTATNNKSNGAAITFPTSTGAWLASASLGYLVFYDAATGGNVLGYAALNNPQVVASSGATLSFAIGSLTITIN